MKVKISIDDGNGRKANLELDDADQQTKMQIIQSVFDLFKVDIDVIEASKNYDRISNAYSNFFSEVQPIEITRKIADPEIKEQLIQAYINNHEEIVTTYKAAESNPDYLATGIKVKQGKELYRTRYECPACYSKGTHYIYKDSKNTWCHKCNHKMSVSAAHPNGFPNRDSYGNYFVAGDYRDEYLFGSQ